MNKLVLLCVVAGAVSACALPTTSNIEKIESKQGVSVIEMWALQQCQADLSQLDSWKDYTATLSLDAQKQAQNQVCACVANLAVEKMDKHEKLAQLSREWQSVMKRFNQTVLSSCIEKLY